MREFHLENSLGERKSLMLETSFFQSPQGLGIGSDIEFESIGNGFYADVKEEYAQRNIVGELVFMDEPYADYKTLIDWICSGYPLSLVYKPSAIEYYVDIKVEYIEKGEISYDTGVLTCPVSFLATSPIYKPAPTVFNFSVDDETDYRVYPFAIEAYYSLSNASNSIDITAGGHYPAAMKVIAFGELSDPVLTLTNKTTGVEIGKCELAGLTVASGDYMVYSTIPTDSGVWSVSGGVETDLANYTSIADNNFPEIPRNVPCTVKLEFTGPSTTATLYVYEYYGSV